MLTGQFYYYLKVLDHVRFPLTADEASRLDILGLPYISATALNQIDQTAIPNEIKNLFITSYFGFLTENGLEDIVCFWVWLTTPLRRQDIFRKIKQKSDFQRDVREWGKEGFQFQKLDEVLKSGQFSTREDDLALLYGLRFLEIFTNYTTAEHKHTIASPSMQSPEDSDKRIKYSTKPQILVITTDELSPLFMNIGCEAIPLLSNPEKMVIDIQAVLKSEPAIKVILVEGEDSSYLVSLIRKNVGVEILVSSITLPLKSSTFINQPGNIAEQKPKTFFDAIAKSTLGVRLD